MLEDRNRRRDLWAVAAVVGVAAVMRVWGLFHDLPFSFYGDELHFIKRSMALGAGDLNPHWFHKPAFLMYVLAFVYGIYYLVGALFGRFESVEAFGAYFLQEPGNFILIGRIVVALFGIATVYVVYLIARRIYRSHRSGVAAGLVAAVSFPMIFASQQAKADVPSGFLIALSFYWYLKSLDGGRKKPLVIAALLAGAAMGTKYYGVILLPVFALGELSRRFKQHATWNNVFLRGALVLVLFTVGFFVTSPYNFLDPTWSRSITDRIDDVTGGAQEMLYDPDYRVEYRPGLGAMFGATGHFMGRFVSEHSLGIALSIAVFLGALTALRRTRFRIAAGLAIATCFSFLVASVTISPYHVNARHFNAILPLTCIFVWPGILFLARLVRIPTPWRGRAVAVLFAASLATTFFASVRHNRDVLRLDSRVASYRWILEHVPRDQGILLDDYGPILQPNEAAVKRLRDRMEEIGLGDGFTRFHKVRLELLAKHPAPRGFDITELGHAWWLPREATNAELRSEWKHRDMGNPLIDRLPATLDEYRKAGVRYVITNSEAKGRYFPTNGPPRTKNYPTWVAFYRSLDDQKLLKTFDPDEWGGKGPVIRVYELIKTEH